MSQRDPSLGRTSLTRPASVVHQAEEAMFDDLCQAVVERFGVDGPPDDMVMTPAVLRELAEAAGFSRPDQEQDMTYSAVAFVREQARRRKREDTVYALGVVTDDKWKHQATFLVTGRVKEGIKAQIASGATGVCFTDTEGREVLLILRNLLAMTFAEWKDGPC